MAARSLLGEFERRRGATAWVYRAIVLVLLLLTLTTIAPLLWLAGNAFKAPQEFRERPLRMVPMERAAVAVPAVENRGEGKVEIAGGHGRALTRTYEALFVASNEAQVGEQRVLVSGETTVLLEGVQVRFLGSFAEGDRFTLTSRQWQTQNYAQAWEGVDFVRHSLNTFALMALTWGLHIGVNALGAYALSRLRFPGSRLVLFAFLMTMMVPWFAVFIPLYLTVTQLGLTVPFYGWPAVVIPAGFNAFFLILFKSFFDGLPNDLLDAARIDGAGEMQIFRRIAIPLSKPIVAVITVFSLLATWNDFLWPYLVISEEAGEPIMVRLFNYERLGTAPIEHVMAALAMAMVPPLVLFLIFQRQIAAGFTLSGIKG